MLSAEQRLQIVGRASAYLNGSEDAARALEHWCYVLHDDDPRTYHHALKACLHDWSSAHDDDIHAFVLRVLEATTEHYDDTDRPASPVREEDDPSGLFVCSRCHSRSVQTRQMQTRSADEPMTVFCRCQACGKRWKQ